MCLFVHVNVCMYVFVYSCKSVHVVCVCVCSCNFLRHFPLALVISKLDICENGGDSKPFSAQKVIFR